MQPPRVSVIVPANESGQARYDTLALTMANTMSFTLRLLGDYSIEPVPRGTDERVRIGNDEEIARFAEERDLDYMVLGELSETDSGGIAFEVVVWDREAQGVTIREDAVAESLFDTFDVADDLTLEVLSAMSGRRIAFGSLRVELPGYTGAFIALVDGEFVGFNSRSIESLPAGEREVEVLPLTTDGSSGRRVATRVLVEPEQTATVSFELDSPENSWFLPELISFGGEESDTQGEGLPSAPQPSWFDAGFEEGVNPDVSLFNLPGFSPLSSGAWFAETVRAESLAARYPNVPWEIDGSLAEWPADALYYPYPSNRNAGDPVRLRGYQVAYGLDAIYLAIEFGEGYEAFFGNSEPHVFLESTMTGAGRSVRRNFVYKRQSGRWWAEERLNRNPYEDFPFERLPGATASTEGRVLELVIPIEEFEGDRFIYFTDISLEEVRGGGLELVMRAGEPTEPERGRRIAQ